MVMVMVDNHPLQDYGISGTLIIDENAAPQKTQIHLVIVTTRTEEMDQLTELF